MVTDAQHSLFSTALDSSRRFQVIEGREESRTTIRPFLFGNVKLTDDDALACADIEVIKNAGTIQLRYWRVRNLRTVESFSPAPPSTQPIHEKKKKAALSHMASYGAAVAKAPTSRLAWNWVDPIDSPYSVVEFRYRSRTLLQLDGHIPDSPEPSPEPAASASPSPPPVAGPSQPRRSSSTLGGSARSPSASASAEAERIAALERELEALRRQERMAELQRELDSLRGGGGASGSGSPSGPQTQGKRAAPSGKLSAKEMKKVKLEEGAKIEREKEENKKKGKKAEVIDLCDSDSD
ncbi:hypothetical protein JCM10213_002383 [Rhodosporidiobolus nylandii]